MQIKCKTPHRCHNNPTQIPYGAPCNPYADPTLTPCKSSGIPIHIPFLRHPAGVQYQSHADPTGGAITLTAFSPFAYLLGVLPAILWNAPCNHLGCSWFHIAVQVWGLEGSLAENPATAKARRTTSLGPSQASTSWASLSEWGALQLLLLPKQITPCGHRLLPTLCVQEAVPNCISTCKGAPTSFVHVHVAFVVPVGVALGMAHKL